MPLRRNYSLSVKIPLLGEIPLNPLHFIKEIRKEAPEPWVQFFKYAICGVIATCILFSVYTAFEIFYPQYISDVLPIHEKQNNLRLVMLIAFIPANIFSYLSNRLLVFTPGRHPTHIEFIIFTGISAISFTGGEIGKTIMVEQGNSNLLAVSMFAICATLINFITRKLFVFAQ